MQFSILNLQSAGFLRPPFWCSFVIALVVRFACAWVSHGQPVADVDSFWQWANRFDAGDNPYSLPPSIHDSADAPGSGASVVFERPVFTVQANYPPLWIHFCWACLKLSEWTGLSFDLFIKLLVSLFDAATTVVVGYLAVACEANASEARKAAFFYAVNPATILVASFHAQNDPVVIGLVAWASWLVLARPFRQAPEVGMLLVGASLAIKPIALLYLPVLVLQVPEWSRRVAWGGFSLPPPLFFWMPYLLHSPTEVIDALRSYRGVPDFGYIGIYNSWNNLGLGSAGIPVDYDLGRAYWPFCVFVLGLAWWRFRKVGLVEQLVAITLALYLVYGRLAAQYLVWIIPFAAALRSPQLRRVTVYSALALLAFYQLHHPGILSGAPSDRVPMGIRISQWSGIFLFAHVMLYIYWFRWMVDWLKSPPYRHRTQREGSMGPCSPSLVSE